jgi:hypothetical protein
LLQQRSIMQVKHYWAAELLLDPSTLLLHEDSCILPTGLGPKCFWETRS